MIEYNGCVLFIQWMWMSLCDSANAADLLHAGYTHVERNWTIVKFMVETYILLKRELMKMNLIWVVMSLLALLIFWGLAVFISFISFALILSFLYISYEQSVWILNVVCSSNR